MDIENLARCKSDGCSNSKSEKAIAITVSVCKRQSVHGLMSQMRMFAVILRYGRKRFWEARVAGAGGSKWGGPILEGAWVASGAASAGD